MAAGSELTSQAIAPGSTAYGDRQSLEAGLASAMGGGGGGGPAGGAQPTAVPNPEDPLGALLSGQIKTGQDLPVTDGLSVGPGAGPSAQAGPMMGDRAAKIRAIATEAASPMVRAAARNMLRRMAREPL